MGILSSLNREQKEAVGLLQIGTFLEYFDLMLYVHMAVLLNELFFPTTDPHTAALFTALAFCSTYVLRPFGALIFGYIGDHIGRKPTVIITTMMMSISCVIMANLPTYAQIGISAAWIVTGCRIAQGLSSMGEMIGAQIYVSEITKHPLQYPLVSFLSVASTLGASVALGVASLVTIYEMNWRIAFWLGAGVAMIGSIARTKLRETPEFLGKKFKNSKRVKEKINKKTLFADFLIYCGWPVTFYFTFIYFNSTLKSLFGYTPEDIIFHNFIVSLVFLLLTVIWCQLSCKIHPLIILKIRGILSLLYTFLLPMLVINCKTPFHIFLLQSILLLVSLAATPAESIFVRVFPVLSRVTMASFIYALTRAFIYVITSFGLVYLTEALGHYGLWIIMLPVTIGFLWGVNHFIKLEQESGALPKQKILQPLLPEVKGS